MLITVLAAIDLDTILQVGVFLFIIISTLAGQIFSKNNQRGPAKGKKPRPRPRPRPKGQEPRPGPLADRRPQAQPWQPIEARLPRETARPRPLLNEPVQPEIVPVEVVPVQPVSIEPSIGRESVAEHVQRHIEKPRRQSQIEQADERMASHLHEAFDHRLGRLGKRSKLTGTTIAGALASRDTPQTAALPLDISARIAQMMQTPEYLSAAIVLNEILKRPEDRWNE
jgi:hypothetical protein